MRGYFPSEDFGGVIGSGGGGSDGQFDDEDGAGGFVVFSADGAAAGVDQFLADGEAEAGAAFVDGVCVEGVGGGLGGEEGFENAGEDVVGDSRAGVGEAYFDAGFAAGAVALQPGGDRQAFTATDDAAQTIGGENVIDFSTEHGGTGVDDEVHEHLLKLAAVHGDGEVGGNIEGEGDAVFGEIARQAGEGFLNCLMDVDGSGIIGAGETEEAFGDIGEPFGAGEGLGEGLGAKGVIGLVAEGVLGVADHGGEDVVEFVGDHCGDHTEGGEFLLLLKRHLELVNTLLQGGNSRFDHLGIEQLAGCLRHRISRGSGCRKQKASRRGG